MSTNSHNSADATWRAWTRSRIERWIAAAQHVNDSIDLPSLQLALKSCLAICLATGLALWLDISATITAITAFMIQQGYVGSTLYRGSLRFIGGTAGAFLAIVVLALFSQDRVLFIGSVSLCIGVIVYLLQGSRYWYAYILAAASLTVVGYGSIEHPQYSFPFFVNWVSGILLAVVVVSTVRVVLWPNLTADVFEKQMRVNFENCGKLLHLMLDSLVEGQDNHAAMDRIEKTLIGGLALPQTTLQTAFFDSWQVDRFEGAYNRLIDQITVMARQIIAARETLRLRKETPDVRDVVQRSKNLSTIATHMKDQMQDLITALGQPRNRTDGVHEIAKDKAALQQSFDELAKEIEQSGAEPFDKAVWFGLHQRLQRLNSHIPELRQTLLNVETAEAKAAAGRDAKTHSTAPPTKRRVMKAVTASILVVAVAYIWILTNWPLALNRVMVYTAVLACFNAMFPAIPRRAIINALVWGITGGAIIYFAILRPMEGIAGLSLALSIGLLPCCYFVNSRNPLNMITGLFTGMIIIGLMDISLQQSYSFSSFADNAIGYCGGFLIGMVILQLFVSRTPEQQFRQQVLAFFKTSQRSLRQLTTDPPWTDQGRSILAAEQSHLVKSFKLSGLWSKMFNPRQASGNAPQKIGQLLANMQSLIFRSALMEDARIQAHDDSNSDRFTSAESPLRKTIEQALADLQSIIVGEKVADQAPSTHAKVHQALKPVVDRFSNSDADQGNAVSLLVLAAYYDALASAIDECHEHLDGLDWQSLDRTYL